MNRENVWVAVIPSSAVSGTAPESRPGVLHVHVTPDVTRVLTRKLGDAEHVTHLLDVDGSAGSVHPAVLFTGARGPDGHLTAEDALDLADLQRRETLYALDGAWFHFVHLYG